MPESEEVARETVCELANMVIGSAITALNDQGFEFRIHPPQVHTGETGEKSTEDQEALVMCFDTARGNVFMNIAMRYNTRRRADRRLGYSRPACQLQRECGPAAALMERSVRENLTATGMAAALCY